MSEYREMSMINLYSSLGYERKSSRRKYETLDAATQSFFREYADQGNKISLSTVNVEAARLCALNFLHEDDRGEFYWPVNSEGILEWANDRHRETITDILTHIFRKKALSDYVKERKEIGDREAAEEEGLQNRKPKRVRRKRPKRKRVTKDDDDDYLSNTYEEPRQNENACIPSSLELDTVKFWNTPPEEPCAQFCVDYIRGLDPQHGLEAVKEFHKWLSSKSAGWPTSANNPLLRFMFDNNLFTVCDYGSEMSAALLWSLGKGTEIEEMTASRTAKWEVVNRRIEELTHQLTQEPYFILAYRRDGVIRMTERFERIWKHKELYWEDGFESSEADHPKPAKKRNKSKSKSKAVRAKTPSVFPNLQEQDDAMSEMLSEQVDMGSRMQLASMAETALEWSGEKVFKCDRLNPETGEPCRVWSKRKYNLQRHIETIHQEGSGGSVGGSRPLQFSFSEFMDVDSEPEINVPARKQTFTRSVSPTDSIVAESRRTEESQPLINTSSLTLSRDTQVSEKTVSRRPTLESTPRLDSSTRPTLILKVPISFPPTPTAPSEENTTEAEQITVIAANGNALAKKPQQTLDEFFISMHDVSKAGWSRAAASQSVTPTDSTASQSLDNTDSTPASTLSSQHHQPISTGGDDSANNCTSKWRAEFSWLDPQESTTAETAHSTNVSSTHGKCQETSTSGHSKCSSPHVSQRTRDSELKYANLQNSTSSTLGSSRSLPVEIVDDSDNPSSPSTRSTKPSSTLSKTPSPQANKPTNESTKEKIVAGVKLQSESPPSPKSMNLHSMLSGETDYRAANPLYPPRPLGEKLEASSPSPPQTTRLQHGPLPPLHSAHTGNSPTSTLTPSHGNSGWLPHAPSTDQRHQRRTMTSAEPLSGSPGPSSAHHQSNEPFQSPVSGGMVKRKAGAWPFRTINEMQRHKHMVPPELNNDNFSVVEGMQDPSSNWASRDTSASKPVTPESQGRNHAQASASAASNMSPETPGSKTLSSQRTDTTETPPSKTSATRRPFPCNEHVRQPSVVSPLPKATSTSPTEMIFQPQRLPEQSSPRLLETRQSSHEASSSTVPAFPSSLTMGTSPTEHSNSGEVGNFIKDIDDFIQRGRSSGVQNEAPSKYTSPYRANTVDQCPQSRSPILQGTICESKKIQACQSLRHTLVSQVQTPQAALLSFIKTNQPHQSFDSQSESPATSQAPNVTRSPTTRPLQFTSPSRDLTPGAEKRVAMPIQEPITPPTQGTPQRRNGSYSFVPPPDAFSPYKSAITPPHDTRVPPAPVLSTDTRLATTSNPSGTSNTPTLTLLIESADGSMSLETTHPFEIVKNSSLSEFFQFYSSVSGTPLSSLTSLEFQLAFGKRLSYEIRRYGGELQWKRLKEVIPSLFERAVRKDMDGRTEWQVLVSSE